MEQTGCSWILPRLKSGGGKVRLALDFSCEVPSVDASAIITELKQAIADLKLDRSVKITND